MNQGLTLKNYLDKKGISISEMSRRMNLTRAAINNYFKTEVFQDETAGKILKALGLSSFEALTEIQSGEIESSYVNESGVHYKSIPTIKSDPNGKSIPFYDTEVFATISPAMSDVVALKPSTFINIPMFSQGEYALQVTGHSMKGLINHGDWVVVKRITNREAIIYGEPYLVVTKSDNLKTVKFVKPSDEDDDALCLIPYNIEQFEPQDIKKNEVLELYRVIGLFRST